MATKYELDTKNYNNNPYLQSLFQQTLGKRYTPDNIPIKDYMY